LTFDRLGFVPGAKDKSGVLTCQRDLNEGRVKKIVKEWDEGRAKLPYVAQVDKRMMILDGQHTCAARYALGQPGVSALVASFGDEREAGEVFRYFNTDPVKLSNFEWWRAGRWVGDPLVIKADNAIEALGFKIAGYSSEITVACIWHVKQMMLVKGGGADHLAEVVHLANESWGGQHQVFRGEILAAISQVLRKYGDKVNRKKAIASWHKDFKPMMLVHAAKERNANEGMKRENAISHQLVISHDRRLGAINKLRPAVEEDDQF
jgi:hypothetical protein